MAKQRAFDQNDAKAASNIRDHGISFDEAAHVFADDNLLLVDTTRPEDRENRTKAVGMIDGTLFTVVFTMRGRRRRLISARRANTKEERAYGDRPG